LTRSRIMPRSNSANTPSIWNMALPAVVEVSSPATAKPAGSSQEGAEVVAVAVFGGCSGFQERFYQHLLRIKMTVSQSEDLTAKIRAKMREQIVAQVLTLRAKSPLR
jgi:hypothetical protein